MIDAIFPRRCIGSGRLLFALLFITMLWPAATLGGGGPENVLLVVNSRSWASRTIANHYARWRQIPVGNIYYLDWAGGEETDVDTFRDDILKPVLGEVKRRQLGRQIDYVVYSSDFPYAIDVAADLPDGAKYAKGSLTSLTYLAPLVLAGRKEYAGLNVNWYYRPFRQDRLVHPTRGFRSQYAWNSSGELVDGAKGQHYLLSTMLAYTAGRGNSVEEALTYLQAASRTDGTEPDGTIYYMSNDNVRARTRSGAFSAAVKELEQLGMNAEVVEGVLPQGKSDVLGVMAGAASFSWERSGSRILPGAIAENLTSYGGILRESAGQTPMTEFLRHGAAGSSGTVVEPYAILAKFPHPMVHVHYARGCSLAEAFYQSVYGPYQLFIIGDALCAPWAKAPVVSVEGVQEGDSLQGEVRIKPSARTMPGVGVKQFRLFINGQLIDEIPDGTAFEFDTTKLRDGHHEFRIVAIDDTPIETQGRRILPVRVDNRDRRIDWTVRPNRQISWGNMLTIEARSPGSKQIVLFQDRKQIGRVPGSRGRIRLDPKEFGLGPVRLQLVGIGEDDSEHVLSKPIELDVTLPTPLSQGDPALQVVKKEKGLLLRAPGGATAVVDNTAAENWLNDAGVTRPRPFSLEGMFEVPRPGVYQFAARLRGDLAIRVDGQTVMQVRSEEQQRHYAPVALAAGWHWLDLRCDPQEDLDVDLLFGGPGLRSVGGNRFFHRR